jgi:predicted dithiol-disulfide oxidoreductase (DUF899 family)
MTTPDIVTREQWLAARKQHLQREKEFSRLRDELSESRRRLPWVKLTQRYQFDTPSGKASLADLFGGRSQLIVYHFMFGPDWAEGCPSCSFWADNFNGIVVHLRHRDAQMIAVSRAPLSKIEAYRQRMGWSFTWVSSYGSDFNHDFGVSFTPEERAAGAVSYNYERREFPSEEAPGISVFAKKDQDIFHTYSCYARGLDMLNGAYHYMDLTPKGRDEASLPHTMAWLRRHDRYDD